MPAGSDGVLSWRQPQRMDREKSSPQHAGSKGRSCIKKLHTHHLLSSVASLVQSHFNSYWLVSDPQYKTRTYCTDG